MALWLVSLVFRSSCLRFDTISMCTEWRWLAKRQTEIEKVRSPQSLFSAYGQSHLNAIVTFVHYVSGAYHQHRRSQNLLRHTESSLQNAYCDSDVTSLH